MCYLLFKPSRSKTNADTTAGSTWPPAQGLPYGQVDIFNQFVTWQGNNCRTRNVVVGTSRQKRKYQEKAELMKFGVESMRCSIKFFGSAKNDSKPTQVRVSPIRRRDILTVYMGAENNNRLAVSRPSSKITKKTPAMARPAPKLYNIHPSGFRELVQELTGNSLDPETLQKPPPAANSNGRLQKFAPPPLSADTTAAFPSLPSPLNLLTPSPVRGMFSPLTAFTPMEWTWLEERSPVSMEYRELAASLIEKAEEEPVPTALSPTAFRQDSPTALSPTAFRQDSNARPPVSSNNGWGSPVSSSYFLYSPRCGNLSPTFGLPSPGTFAGFDLETI